MVYEPLSAGLVMGRTGSFHSGSTHDYDSIENARTVIKDEKKLLVCNDGK